MEWEEFLKRMLPALSAQFFTFCLIYFLIAKKHVAREYRFYMLYLVALILFLIRPAKFPFLAFYNNVYGLKFSVLVLFAVGLPSLLLAIIPPGRETRLIRIIYYGVGTLCGLGYGLFFDNVGNAVLIRELFDLRWKHLDWYWQIDGVYVAHQIQLAVAVLIFIPAVWQVFRELKTSTLHSTRLAFSAGIILFSAFMFVGWSTQMWWIYYAGAIPSALFFSFIVFREIIMLKQRDERFIPLIKDELLQDISFLQNNSMRLAELFNAVGIETQPNRFFVIKADDVSGNQLRSTEVLCVSVSRLLESQLGRNSSMIIPIAMDRFAVCFCDASESVLVLTEKIRSAIAKETEHTASIGIGKKYGNLDEIRYSYQEAFTAVNYASRIGGDVVVSHDEIQASKIEQVYPFHEREALIAGIKSGSHGFIQEASEKLCALLYEYSQGDISFYRERLKEVAAVIFDCKLQAGADAQKVFSRKKESGFSFDTMKAKEEIDALLLKLAVEASEKMSQVPDIQENSFVKQAQEYVKQNYQRDIGVDEVVDALGVSRSHFMKLFKKHCDQSFVQYLTEVRVEQAKLLLLTNSVTDTAFSVGFKDSNYFSTVFKKAVGMTPRQFQNSSK